VLFRSAFVFKRETVHVVDDTRRIAIVEIKTIDCAAKCDLPEVRIRYQLNNHLGSCSVEIDDTAAIISYEEYHPYGTTSLWLCKSSIEVRDRRFRYTGKEKDQESGLYYHGNRYYAAWLARWVSCDPSGIRTSTNTYQYSHNTPVNLIDPNGKDPALPNDKRTPAERNASYQLDPKIEAEIRTQLAVADESERRANFFGRGQKGERGTPLLPLISREAGSYVRSEAAAPNSPAGLGTLKELNANMDVKVLNFTRDSLAVSGAAFAAGYVGAGATLITAPPLGSAAVGQATRLAFQFPKLTQLVVSVAEGLSETPPLLSQQWALAFGGRALATATGGYVASEVADAAEAVVGRGRLLAGEGALDPEVLANRQAWTELTENAPAAARRLFVEGESLAGATELTLIEHGASSNLLAMSRGEAGAEGVVLSGVGQVGPNTLAEILVQAGWSGGQLRLIACSTGMANEAGIIFGEQLSSALGARGAPTVVSAARGLVQVGSELLGTPAPVVVSPRVSVGVGAFGYW